MPAGARPVQLCRVGTPQSAAPLESQRGTTTGPSVPSAPPPPCLESPWGRGLWHTPIPAGTCLPTPRQWLQPRLRGCGLVLLCAPHLLPTPSHSAESCPQSPACSPPGALWLGGSSGLGSLVRAGTPRAGQPVHTYIEIYTYCTERDYIDISILYHRQRHRPRAGLYIVERVGFSSSSVKT